MKTDKVKMSEEEPKLLIAETRFLSREEQCHLAKLWRNHGDVNARNTLVSSIDLFTLRIARKFAKKNIRLLTDFFQEGRMGAMRAVDKFDPALGHKFTTYASWWILAYISRYIASQKKGRYFDESSLDEARYDEGEETHLEGLDDPTAHPDETLGLSGFGDRELVRQAMNLVLSKIEYFVIWQRFYGSSEPTLQDIGDKLGVSRERIRQIEGRALGKLEVAMANWKSRLRKIAYDHDITPLEAARAASAGQFRPPLTLVPQRRKRAAGKK